MTEDFTNFFDVDEFASNATLNGVAVKGIFDNAFELGGVGGAGFSTTQPTFMLTTVDAGTPDGLALVVGGITYTVVGAAPDGTGMTVLTLEKA